MKNFIVSVGFLLVACQFVSAQAFNLGQKSPANPGLYHSSSHYEQPPVRLNQSEAAGTKAPFTPFANSDRPDIGSDNTPHWVRAELESWLNDLSKVSYEKNSSTNSWRNNTGIFSVFHPNRWSEKGLYYPFKPKDEVFEKRTAHSKTFRNSDGSFTTIMLSDLHFRDSEGFWRDVDLSILPDHRTGNNGFDFANLTNNFKTFFSSEPDKGFRIESLEQVISLGMNATLSVYDESGQPTFEVKRNPVEGFIRDRRKVFFENIYPGIDLEKVLLRKGVESGYIINSPAIFAGSKGQVLRFSHEVELHKGWLVLTPDGKQQNTHFSSSSFYVTMPDGSNGIRYNRVVVFDGSFTYDEIMEEIEISAMEEPELSSATLRQVSGKYFSEYNVRFEGSKLVVSYEIPIDWFFDPERVYPVYVDPTVEVIAANGLFSFNANGSPYNTARNKARYQSLFLASDLTSQGIPAGATITAIDFAVSQQPGVEVSNFRIRLQNTSATTTTTWFTSGWTLVYGPTNIGRPTAGSWYTYVLSTPFVWTGNSLAVDISRDNNTRGSGGGMFVRGLINNRAIHWSGNSGTWPFDGTTPTNISYLPAIRLTYELDLGCSEPRNLGVYNITYNQALVSWQGGQHGNPQGYNVFYRIQGAPVWTELYTEDTFILITGLQPNTQYQVQVRANCGTVFSNWVSGSFKTDPPPCDINVLGFEASSPVPVLNEEDGIYYLDVCQGSLITLEANIECNNCQPSTTLMWIINAYDGIGPVSYSDNPVQYIVEYNSGYDAALEINGQTCYSLIPLRIRSSSGPSIHSITDELSGCVGTQIPVSIGTTGSLIEVEPYYGQTSATLAVGDTTFIPDGPNCGTQCYESSVTFTDFPIGAKIKNPADILFLRINMEHSFIGDLQISLVGPNNCGSAIILQDFNTIAQGGYDDYTYTWPHMSGSSFQRVGFGAPNIADLGNISGQNFCDPQMWYNAPGTGWDYVWSNNGNFSYAPGNALVYEAVNISQYPTVPYYRVNPSDPVNFTNFYKPFQGFENLVGCPLNGTWKVKVCDSRAAYNGWIFEWEIALDPDLLPTPWSYTPEIDYVAWNLGGNAGVEYISGGDPLVYEITPNITLASGQYTGALTVYDKYGCGISSEIGYEVSGIPVIPEIEPNDYLWDGFSSEIWDNTLANNWLKKTQNSFELAETPPGANTNVFIIDYCRVNFMPLINQNVDCKDLVIIDGELSIANNQIISLTGDFDNRATFHANNGTVIFNGNGLQNVSAGGANFHNVTVINNGSGIRLLDDNLRVEGTLTLISGIINTNSNRVEIINPNASALSGGNANAFIFGYLRRHIEPNQSVYAFPVGTSNAYRLAQIVNNNLEGVSYIDAAFISPFDNFGSLDPEKAHDLGTLYSSVAPEGIWRLTPNQQPVGGAYEVRLWFNGGGQNAFANLIDNQFGLLKRPDGSSLASDWTGQPGGGFLNPEFTPGRTIASGYAARNQLTSFSEFSIGIFDIPLPIELLWFEANFTNGKVILNWSTGSEINNDYFTIERSQDAFIPEVMGFVSGAGNSNQTLHYQFIDHDPLPGISYYRLKQTDYDGSFEYSKWVVVQVDGIGGRLQALAISQPQGLLLRIYSPTERPLQVQLADIYGKVIHREQLNPSSPGHIETFVPMPLSERRVLIYRITDGLDVVTGKVIR